MIEASAPCHPLFLPDSLVPVPWNETTKFDEAQSAPAVASDRDLTTMGCAP